MRYFVRLDPQLNPTALFRTDDTTRNEVYAGGTWRPYRHPLTLIVSGIGGDADYHEITEAQANIVEQRLNNRRT